MERADIKAQQAHYDNKLAMTYTKASAYNTTNNEKVNLSLVRKSRDG